jgi:hypothetical protein
MAVKKQAKTKTRCTKALPPTKKLVVRLLTKYFDTDKSDDETDFKPFQADIIRMI